MQASRVPRRTDGPVSPQKTVQSPEAATPDGPQTAVDVPTSVADDGPTPYPGYVPPDNAPLMELIDLVAIRSDVVPKPPTPLQQEE